LLARSLFGNAVSRENEEGEVLYGHQATGAPETARRQKANSIGSPTDLVFRKPMRAQRLAISEFDQRCNRQVFKLHLRIETITEVGGKPAPPCKRHGKERVGSTIKNLALILYLWHQSCAYARCASISRFLLIPSGESVIARMIKRVVC